METPPISKALNRDAAALIALWLQIYGGDPPPQNTEISPAAGLVAAALVTQLTAELGAPMLSDAELDVRLSRFGLGLGDGHEHVSDEAIKIVGGWTCVKGPEGEPGCCVLLPYHVVGGPGEGTDHP
ncbi:MAG TPA: hypothetical protein VMC03_22100 [Streptosporangiaceae bacterium]|nr:hypothetical protein [Streptosporangiaceae bacterium]